MKTPLLFYLSVITVILLFMQCGGNPPSNQSGSNQSAPSMIKDEPEKSSDYDSNKGEGKYTNVELDKTLNQEMAISGEKIQSVKCASCHKLTEERLVGPGWKGVTERRKPEWVMNFVTNPDPMIDKDPALQEQLEVCMVRMPNQSLSDEEARHILEFMRQNDGVK